MDGTDTLEKLPALEPGKITAPDGTVSDDSIDAAIANWQERSPLGDTYEDLLTAEIG